MKLKLILSAIVLCLATVPFAQTADSAVVQTPAVSVKANPADSAFSKAYVSIEGSNLVIPFITFLCNLHTENRSVKYFHSISKFC